jgi:chorismate-pyruvate lyase
MVVISISTEDSIYMLQRISDLENISNIKLSLLEKILLAETGTVEQILTMLTNSEVAIKILRQKKCNELIKREVRIINKKTGENLVYATSNIVPCNLPDEVIRQIEQKQLSIGSIITNYQLETFRKILKIGYISKTRSLFRVYHIIHKGKVSFKIKEVFPLNTKFYHNS